MTEEEQFAEIIDHIVMTTEGGELAKGIKWLDQESQKRGISFYDMALIVVQKHLTKHRAEQWLKSR